ncbi:DUF3572 domain-containing protein [Actibacterium pelagium]|uniref:DUF3572 domain-containing protein n=1 Tax=Actibacterium pelagium TaxID=2029103 RepID=A0A917AKW4_9RHOB|nr:DUF3572 domain-containing protein [Actibacterium pelagium]GGE59762.1 hypothetical protein GCM10011517_29180 [Actibacterium pelagium]
MTGEQAETIALKALAWLAAEDDLLPVFMGSTGVAQSDLAERAAEPEFLVSVLDFLTMDDRWVVAFCDRQGLPYETPLQAKMALPGGAQTHWT